MVKTQRTALRALAVTVSLVALASCTTTKPLQAVDVKAVDNPPILRTEQVDRIVSSAHTASEAADTDLQPASLQNRFAGASLDSRVGSYNAKPKFAERRMPEKVGQTRLIDIVPQTHTWPRTFMTVTQADPKITPVLRVFRQENARANYQEVVAAPLLPQAVVPAVTSPQKGAQLVGPADAEGTNVSPTEAFAQLSDVLANGTASAHAEKFVDNPFFATLAKEQATEKKAATVECVDCFTYTVKHTPRPDQVWAVRRSDGGILAIAAFDLTREFKVKSAGAKLPLSGELKALAGKKEATTELKINSVETVALSIPPASAGKKIEVIGADRTLTTVLAK